MNTVKGLAAIGKYNGWFPEMTVVSVASVFRSETQVHIWLTGRGYRCSVLLIMTNEKVNCSGRYVPFCLHPLLLMYHDHKHHNCDQRGGAQQQVCPLPMIGGHLLTTTTSDDCTVRPPTTTTRQGRQETIAHQGQWPHHCEQR